MAEYRVIQKMLEETKKISIYKDIRLLVGYRMIPEDTASVVVYL
jgi:hypothetical protein